MRRLVFLACLLLVIAVSTFDALAAPARHALVIGNWSYENSPLKNPKNDVRGMAKTLRGLGFDVIAVENGSQREMRYAILEFGRALRTKGGFGLFYFAGHGIQVKGRNYLLPVNALIEFEEEVPIEAIDVANVLARMEVAENGLNVVILDSCRNNPFARSFRSASQGLASIDAPAGTLIAYATAPGKVALDGKGENGLYTGELIKAMAVADITVEEAFKQVRSAVSTQSQGLQILWESTSLMGRLSFSAPKAVADTKDQPAAGAGGETSGATRDLSSALKSRENKRRLGHYSTADGMVGFTLDRSGEVPAVRFDDENEILVLTPEIRREETEFERDDGGVILQVPVGKSLQVWVPGRGWDTVERDGGADPLRLPSVDRAAAENRLKSVKTALHDHLNITADLTVDWDRLDEAPGTLVMALNSLVATADRAQSDALARQVVASGLTRIHITRAPATAVQRTEKGITVHLAPEAGLAGSPSSHRLWDVLTADALKQMKMRKKAQDGFTKAIADTEKACGVLIPITMDWSTLAAKDRSIYWCEEVLDTLDRLCKHPVGKAAVTEQLRGLDCRFGPERTLTLSPDGHLSFTFERRSSNNGRFIHRFLMNNL